MAIDPSYAFEAFQSRLKDLEPFVDSRDLRLIFDQEGNVYVSGPNFQRELKGQHSDELTQEITDIAAEFCPRRPPKGQNNGGM
jgi:hypothetical protein